MNKNIISLFIFALIIGISHCQYNEETNDLHERVQPPVDYLGLLPPECRQCDREGNRIADQIKSPESIRRIQEIVRPFCDYLGFFSQNCNDLVTTHTAIIVQILLRYSTPYDSCVKLGLCPPTIPIPRIQAKYEDICSNIVYSMKSQLDSVPITQIVQEVSQRLAITGEYKELLDQSIEVLISGAVETLKVILNKETFCKLE